MSRRVTLVVIAILLLGGTRPVTPPTGAATPVADPAFEQVWGRTDQPVALGLATRTWLWGPEPLTAGMHERYLTAPNQQRLVQYFDKGRMEINDPSGDPAGPWYVTSGLLTRELISGRIQVDTSRFLDTGSGAAIAVAGDPDNAFPTYAALRDLIDRGSTDQTGSAATRALNPDSSTGVHPEAAADPGAGYATYVSYLGPSGEPVGYNIPLAFWRFMTGSGLVTGLDGRPATADPLFDWLFVLGYPLADPFWVQVRVAGAERWVLVQPFERRVLTYTPGNPAGWEVEMGNIGRHYAGWRYAQTPSTPLAADTARYALADGRDWTYSTTIGLDETWHITGRTDAFSGGTELVSRLETKWDGRRVSYWGADDRGLLLYGVDRLGADRSIADSTVYWPPIPAFPASEPTVGQSWSTSTTALSLTGPPVQQTVAIRVAGYQLVGTPAGTFTAWRLSVQIASAGQATTRAMTVWFAPGTGVVQWLDGDFGAQLKATTTAP